MFLYALPKMKRDMEMLSPSMGWTNLLKNTLFFVYRKDFGWAL